MRAKEEGAPVEIPPERTPNPEAEDGKPEMLRFGNGFTSMGHRRNPVSEHDRVNDESAARLLAAFPTQKESEMEKKGLEAMLTDRHKEQAFNELIRPKLQAMSMFDAFEVGANWAASVLASGASHPEPAPEFDAVLAEYAQACIHHDSAGMRAGYIKLRALYAAPQAGASQPEPLQWVPCEQPNIDDETFAKWKSLPSDGEFVYRRDPNCLSKWLRIPVAATPSRSGE